MKWYLLMGALVLSACDETTGIGGVSYTPPPGYILVTDPDLGIHTWRRIEGRRAFFREKSSATGTDFGAYYMDVNCGQQTYRTGNSSWLPLRDLPPDSIGRAAFWDICRES